MLRQQSAESYREKQPAPGARTYVATSLAYAPRQNRLLAALPPEVYGRLKPDLEFVPLPVGHTIYSGGDARKYLYFITTGLISRFYVTENGASAELSVTGNEGVIGIASILGGESTPSQAKVQIAGHAYRLSGHVLRNELTLGGPLLYILLRYTQALMVQTGQMAVCNTHHSLQARLCRWLLSCLDRLPSNELTITQEQIANMLGVRREGITEAARKLQFAGAIQYRRGHISIRDRLQLEAQSCECYAVVKREYDRLLRPEKTGCSADVRHAIVAVIPTRPASRVTTVNYAPAA